MTQLEVVSKKLRDYMLKSGLNKKQISRLTGVTQLTITKILEFDGVTINISTFRKLVVGLNLRVNDLLLE